MARTHKSLKKVSLTEKNIICPHGDAELAVRSPPLRAPAGNSLVFSPHGGLTATRRTISYRSIICAMAKPFTVPPLRRKRGNPNWGRVLPFPPAAATEFEMQVRQLGLTTQTCADSIELRTWCEHNRNRCYVPEWLLGTWGIPVDPNFSW